MTKSPSIYLYYAAFTHSGKRYQENQDALLLAGKVQQSAGFWQAQIPVTEKQRLAIADGAGGLPCAAAASRKLLEALAELDITRPTMPPRQRLIPLHNRLVKASQTQRSLCNAGSTLITAEIGGDGQIMLWHAGDSRGYVFGLDGLRRLTDDHTLAFCLGRLGQQAPKNLQAFSHTSMGQALDNLFVFSSAAEEPFIGLQSLRLKSGEKMLMVSDGITQYCSDEELAECLAETDLENSLHRIVERVMNTAAEDNFSAILFSLETC